MNEPTDHENPAVSRKANTCVLVDRLYSTERARASLWGDVLAPESFSEKSITEEKKAGRPALIHRFSLLIVNWDAANGDYVCGSDDTFLFFLTRSDRRDAFLGGGGTILCEFQSGTLGRLHQQAYDAIFGAAEVEVVNSDTIFLAGNWGRRTEQNKWNSRKVKVGSAYKDSHPLLAGFPEMLESRHQGEAPLYFFDNERPQSDYYWYQHRDSLYNGWFSMWGRDWVPLLVADLRYPWPLYTQWLNPPPAVLLAKCHRGGLLLASTMWIAGSKCSELVSSIQKAQLSTIEKAHKTIKQHRVAYDLLIGAGLIVLIAFCLVRFGWLRDNIFTEIGAVWGTVILFRFWVHLIWKRPYGVNPVQFARLGLTAFWDTI
jgi:hypothetical protein